MRSVSLILFFGFLLVPSTSGQEPDFARGTVPSWFRSMPQNGEALWAVGYAPVYRNPDTAFAEARANAYDQLRRARDVTIEGERLYESLPGRPLSFRGQEFTRSNLPDTLRSVSYVDSVQTLGMTLVLAGWTSGADQSALASPPREGTTFSSDPPGWIRHPQSTDAGLRAVGTAQVHYHPLNGWRKAERRARERVALRAASEVGELTRTVDRSRHAIGRVQTGVRLQDSQIVSRWTDGSRCYVLVKGRVTETLMK